MIGAPLPYYSRQILSKCRARSRIFISLLRQTMVIPTRYNFIQISPEVRLCLSYKSCPDFAMRRL